MTARPVSRPILGTNGQLGIAETLMLQEKARYEEFRRQHAKQNRDLVRVNTQRLEEIQSLKAEKDGLQAIILEERAEKATLAADLKRVKDELARVRSESTREALDTLLAVVPTLRQLREKLDSSSSSPTRQRRSDPGNRYVRVNPYEDRVFIAASGQTNLADLTERTERETESDSGSALGVNGSLASRARSLSASPNRGMQDLAIRRRRSVSAQDRPSPPVRAEEAPVPHLTPMALQIDQPIPQTRKRRISGIDPLRGSSLSPEVESPVYPTIAATEQTRPTASVSRIAAEQVKGQRIRVVDVDLTKIRRDAPIVPEQADSEAKIRKRTTISTIVTSVPVRDESRPTPTGLSAQDRSDTAKELKSSPIKKGVPTEHESTLIRMAGRNSLGAADGADANVDEDDEAENGGRQTRRARKSVNYKEPSLHTKMRKPDGGKLNVASSASKSRTPSRQRSQGTETPTPTPQIGISAPNFEPSHLQAESALAPTGLMRLQEKLAKKEVGETAELTQAAVRRKSVLPKSGRGDNFTAGPAKAESAVARSGSKGLYVMTGDKQMAKENAHSANDPAATTAEVGNLETTATTSSRRRLAQLSINALPTGEDGQSTSNGTSVNIKSIMEVTDKPKFSGVDDLTSTSTQKARLGRRRSSLFRPTDV